MDEEPVRYLRWHQVAARLGTLTLSAPLAREACGQFVDFLKEQVMTVEQVGWELQDGILALRRLARMLEVALEAAQIPIYRRTAGWDWMGYYLGRDTGMWAGVHFTAPEIVKIQYETAKADRAAFDQLGRGDWNDGKPRFTIDLASEAVHLFARSAESQLSVLTEFLRNGYRDASSCVAVKGTASMPSVAPS